MGPLSLWRFLSSSSNSESTCCPVGGYDLHADPGNRHPTAPYLGKRLGSKRAYVWTLAAFLIGSALCGFAGICRHWSLNNNWRQGYRERPSGNYWDRVLT